MATVALVEAIAPELSGDARIEQFIELAAARLSPTAWGSLYSQGVAYLAAHLLTVSPSGGGGPTGPVASRSALAVSESYAVAATGTSDDDLRRSSHGTTFLGLRAQLAATAPTVIRI